MGLHPIGDYDDDDSDPFWIYICPKGVDQRVPGWSHKRMMGLCTGSPAHPTALWSVFYAHIKREVECLWIGLRKGGQGSEKGPILSDRPLR